MRFSRYNVWVEGDDGHDHVFNGVSGELVAVPSAQRVAIERALVDNDYSDIGGELARRLVEARVLVGDDADEVGRLRNRYRMSGTDPRQLGLTLVTSLGCNFDCPYCFEDKRPSIMSPAVRGAVVRLVEDSLDGLEVLGVTWMGGEPLLGKDALFDLSDRMIRLCDANDVAYSADILTNGWHLTPEVCDQLVARRVTSAQVTIDGPPEVHDRMRPRVGGGPTFDRIVDNLAAAADQLAISVRVNIDTGNFGRVGELFSLLADRGLAGRVHVSAGKLIDFENNPDAPMASYGKQCFTSPEFARVSLEFDALAEHYGLAKPGLPTPTGMPCTAVQRNSIVVGSEGELYSCWDDIGNLDEAVGHITSYWDTNSRLHRWFRYDPFSDEQCTSCIALPVCMGGCAYYSFAGTRSDDKCGTFRYTYREQVERYLRFEAGDPVEVGELPLISLATATAASASPASSTPVQLRRSQGGAVVVS